jgi:hypothetical protein
MFIDNRFNTMSVRVENESGKIIRTMFRMRSHSSIIAAALFKRRPIESGHSLSRTRPKSNVETLTWHEASLGAKPDRKFVLGTG